jgi:hypothetical protein
MRKIITSVVLLSAFTLLLAPAAHAAGSTATTVNISGTVSLPGFGSVSVRAHASGTTTLLSGGGTDSPPPNIPPGNPAVCQWPLTGSVSGSVVKLAGTVTQSSVRAEIGTAVTLTADASTGAITWTFGGFPLTGTGTVEIRTG